MPTGPHPSHFEEIRIGGGYDDPADGGADLAKDGDITTTGSIATDGDLRLGGAFLPAAARRGLSAHGLLALWRCDDAGLVRDVSGNGDDLTVAGASLAPGKYGEALAFAGSGQAQSATTAIATNYGNADITFSCWFRTTATGQAQRLMGWQHDAGGLYPGCMLELRSGNLLSALLFDGANPGVRAETDAAPLQDGAWHHAAAVFDRAAALVSLYVDGRLADTAAAAGVGDCGGAQRFTLARTSRSASEYFTGSLDEVSVWGRALDAEEVSAVYALAHELAPDHGSRLVQGDVVAAGSLAVEGGAVGCGAAGAARGHVRLHHGPAGAAPGCLEFRSPNGTAWYVFAEDDGTLRIGPAFPTHNTDGEPVGSQF